MNGIITAPVESPTLLVLPDRRDLGFLDEKEAMRYTSASHLTIRKLRSWRMQDGTNLYHLRDLDAFNQWYKQKRK